MSLTVVSLLTCNKLWMHIHIESVQCSIILGKEDAPSLPHKTKQQTSNRKRPSSKRLSNISLFDVSFNARRFFLDAPGSPCSGWTTSKGLTFETKASLNTLAPAGGQWKGQAGPSSQLSESARSPASPSSPSWVKEALLPLLAVPHPLAPCPAPHCGPALGEGTGRKVHHAGGLVRASSPACSLAAPGLSGCAAAETL